jgi:(p)ppGpp synthase/HD superfamily hydrolase
MAKPIPHVFLTDRYAQGVAYACVVHATQVRKGSTVSYLSHLLGVSSLVIEAGGDEDQAIAGLLHDAVEDAGGRARLADVEARFGPRVAKIVEACSDSTDAEWKRVTPYWERKQAYLDRLADEPDEVLLVSLADKVHNARSIVTDLNERGVDLTIGKFKANPDQLLRYYGACLRIGRERSVSPALVWPLALAIRDIEVALLP